MSIASMLALLQVVHCGHSVLADLRSGLQRDGWPIKNDALAISPWSYVDYGPIRRRSYGLAYALIPCWSQQADDTVS